MNPRNLLSSIIVFFCFALASAAPFGNSTTTTIKKPLLAFFMSPTIQNTTTLGQVMTAYNITTHLAIKRNDEAVIR
jgi:hypothetical protein